MPTPAVCRLWSRLDWNLGLSPRHGPRTWAWDCPFVGHMVVETCSNSLRSHSLTAHLQPRFHNVDWCVSKHAGSPRYPSDKEGSDVANVLGLVPTLEPVLEIRVDKEPDHLVGALFEDGGNQALIGTPDSWPVEGGGELQSLITDILEQAFDVYTMG